MDTRQQEEIELSEENTQQEESEIESSEEGPQQQEELEIEPSEEGPQQQEESETKKELSEAEKNRFIEIYKLHAQLASDFSNRLAATNRFYPAIMSGLIVIYFTFLQRKGEIFPDKFMNTFVVGISSAIFPDKPMNALIVGIPTVTIGILGCLFAALWGFSIESYLRGISRKYEILKKLEDELEFQFFKQEWELLGEQKRREPYDQLSWFETYLPMVFFVIFSLIIIGGLLIMMPPAWVAVILRPEFYILFREAGIL